MTKLFDEVSFKTSTLITRAYSTSFSMAVAVLSPQCRQAIYSIYGFVRFADEIVDTFLLAKQEQLLLKFEADFYEALSDGISMNPVLHSFVLTVRKYAIPTHLIDSFLYSMKLDLQKQVYTNRGELDEYIYGSADVVGLMCLMVFVEGDIKRYEALVEPAMKLGSALQKVNFLRDIAADQQQLGRSYFPELGSHPFSSQSKKSIEASIQRDFEMALPGIKQLPGRSRMAVALAYFYYRGLFNVIRRSSPRQLFKRRVRLPGLFKYLILFRVTILYYTKQL